MDKVLDSTQIVSGIAVLVSFLAGYRYGVRNLDEQTAKSTAQSTAGNERVIFTLHRYQSIILKISILTELLA